VYVGDCVSFTEIDYTKLMKKYKKKRERERAISREIETNKFLIKKPKLFSQCIQKKFHG